MENDKKGQEKLIQGITEDARNEAESIIREIEKSIAERKAAAKLQVETILKEAQKKAEEQAVQIQKSADQSAETEIRRIQLNTQKNLLNRIIRDAEVLIEKKIEDESYKGILNDWIVEAALGLAADAAEINTSQKERRYIDEQLLNEAAEKIKSLTGRVMSLKKSKSSPLTAQGIILTSMDGKKAFNNQVHVRILRYQSRIRSLINRRLFSKEREGP